MKELHRWLQEKLAGTPRSDFLLAVASGLIAWTIVLFLRAAVGEETTAVVHVNRRPDLTPLILLLERMLPRPFVAFPGIGLPREGASRSRSAPSIVR
jgi:hypothetical protein